MNFEQKKQLIGMNNSMVVKKPIGTCDHVATREERNKFIVEHVNDFDVDDWVIFIHVVSPVPAEIKEDIEMWRVVYPAFMTNGVKYSFKFIEQMRFRMAVTTLEEEWGFDVTKPETYQSVDKTSKLN